MGGGEKDHIQQGGWRLPLVPSMCGLGQVLSPPWPSVSICNPNPL